MEREKLISKLNIKDYNNKLEKILSKKEFTEDTKNLLLNMLYKVENSYKDFAMVTVEERTKNDILEEILSIIEEDCNTIKIIKTKSSKSISDEKKIVTYLNVRKMLYEIYQIRHYKFSVQDKYQIIKPSIENTLNQGYSIAKNEIIRDFDGWAWNIATEEIENYTANFVYQNLKILVGQEFLEEWQKNNKQDYISKLYNKLKKKYGIELADKIFRLVIQISIINFTKKEQTEKNRLIQIQEELQKKFDEINDKKLYINRIGNEKRNIVKKIKEIDNTITDDKKLKKCFIAKNELLDMEHRIFSLSDLVEQLEKEREELLKQMEELSKQMEPESFIEKKKDLEKNLSLIKEIELESDDKKIYEQKIKELINCVIKAISIQINNTVEKDEIKKIIYKLRYYSYIYLKSNKQVQSLINLNPINKLAITNACKQKIMTIFSPDIKENYEVLKYIFQSDIIELEKIYIKVHQNKEKTVLDILDEDTLYRTIEIDKVKELNIKQNKKIKVFI